MKYGTILLISVMLCFALASRKVVNFIGSFYPVAKPLECVKLNVDGVPVKVAILQNNPARRSSLVYIFNNGSIHEISYGDLREMDAEKVACK